MYVGKTLTQKLIEAHLVSGRIEPGGEIGIRIDQTLTQDATGTMAYLQFEAMGIDRVRTELSMSYIDHNTIQIGFESADDHRYLQTVARRYGIRLSRAGNGICHQVHLERFGKPGKTLLGSDSHTSTCGALGMLAIGAGGLDVALAMAGEPFFLDLPGGRSGSISRESFAPWVSAKDVILKLLEIFTTKGNVGRVFEYGGDGLGGLTVPERATIANMGAELGLTTSVFPSDSMTRRFLAAEKREARLGRAFSRPRCRIREGHQYQSRRARPPGSQTPQPGQHRNRSGAGRDTGRPGLYRQLHELLVPGTRDGGPDPARQGRAPPGEFHRHARLPAGPGEHCPGRVSRRPALLGGAAHGEQLRLLHRRQSQPRVRGRVASDLEPEFLRPLGDGGCRGLPGEPRDGGRGSPHRGIHGPEGSRHGLPRSPHAASVPRRRLHDPRAGARRKRPPGWRSSGDPTSATRLKTGPCRSSSTAR